MRIKKTQTLDTGGLEGDVGCGYGQVLDDLKTFLFVAYLYFLTSKNEQITVFVTRLIRKRFI